jgi:hypothetical protein
MILLLQKGIIFPSHQYCLKTKRWHLASLFCYCACLENRPSNLKIHQHHRVRAHGCRQTHLSCHNVKAHFRGTVNTTIKRAIYPYVLFLFNVCIHSPYPSISFETINKLKLFFEYCIPRPQDVGHLRLRYCNFFSPFYNLNCSA